jgi:ubiquinone/menaquinone biosynthesis C-methylase UbiE
LTVTQADVKAARDDPKLANVLYHDYEASTYDGKWSITFDERCTEFARDRFVCIAGRDGWPYGSALEIGAGTGFFALNLKRAGVLGRVAVTDISPGMVEVAICNGARCGFQVEGKVADAETLPYPDETFDLVVGHAVLHHIPDVEQALREALRVLRPGGRFVFAGEPTRHGDVIARRLSTWTWAMASRAVRLPVVRRWGRTQQELAESSATAALEWVVDLHTFTPSELARLALRAGAGEVRVGTEELTAAWFGWPIRTFECTVQAERLPARYYLAVYRIWQTLMALDSRVLARVVPAGLYYNALVTGVRP